MFWWMSFFDRWPQVLRPNGQTFALHLLESFVHSTHSHSVRDEVEWTPAASLPHSRSIVAPIEDSRVVYNVHSSIDICTLLRWYCFYTRLMPPWCSADTEALSLTRILRCDPVWASLWALHLPCASASASDQAPRSHSPFSVPAEDSLVATHLVPRRARSDQTATSRSQWEAGTGKRIAFSILNHRFPLSSFHALAMRLLDCSLVWISVLIVGLWC
jgi:hypothetical protein